MAAPQQALETGVPSASVSLTTGVTGILPVVNGGTSLATLTPNGVLIGNGTSAPTFIIPGASGNVLTSNGTTWASSAPTASSAAFTYSATAPLVPSIGDRWVDSTAGILYTRVNDGSSTQWVEF